MDKKLSATFIKERQKSLLEEKEKLAHQIAELKKSDPFLDPDHASDNAAVDTDAREQIDHQTIEAEVEEMKKRAQDIDLALSKIDKKTYGTCEKCENVILLKRLELIPEARYCVECEGRLRR
jgi:DnaK suppressor protein